MIKFLTEYEVGKVRGDQVVTRECYIAMFGDGRPLINHEHRRTTNGYRAH